MAYHAVMRNQYHPSFIILSSDEKFPKYHGNIDDSAAYKLIELPNCIGAFSVDAKKIQTFIKEITPYIKHLTEKHPINNGLNFIARKFKETVHAHILIPNIAYLLDVPNYEYKSNLVFDSLLMNFFRNIVVDTILTDLTTTQTEEQ